MPVDRCVCFEISFKRLKAYADRYGCGLEELQEAFGCGRGCALCVPYIRRMLLSGATEFDCLTDEPEASV